MNITSPPNTLTRIPFFHAIHTHNDDQREELIESQTDGKGSLGCFAFTEKAAGVMSGAGE